MSRTTIETRAGSSVTPTPELIEDNILKSQYDQALEMCTVMLNHSEESRSNPKLLYLKARTELGIRKFEDAWNTIKIITKEQQDSEVLVLKSQIEMYLGRHLESLASANSAIEADHTKVGAYVFKTQALKHLYRDEEAAETLRQGVDLVKTLHGVRSVKTDLEKAFLARLCHEYDIAIKYANYVIEQAPNYASGYVHLGTNFLLKFMSSCVDGERRDIEGMGAGASASGESSSDLYEKAIKAFQKALELNPTDSVATYYMGVALESAGHQEEALSHYHKAAEMSPGYANAVLALVKIHMQRGEDEHALVHINQLVEVNPSEEALLAKAKALESAGKNDDAIGVLMELSAMNPENHYYHYRKAIIHDAKGEHEAALASCNEALRLKPQDSYVTHQKALTLSFLGQYPESIATIEDVLKSNPDFALAHQAKGYILSEIATEPAAHSFVYFFCKLPAAEQPSEVVALITDGKFDAAEVWYYNKITASNRESFELFKQAESEMDSGSLATAVITLNRAVEINPNFVLAYSKLVEIFNKQGLTELSASITSSHLATPYGTSILGDTKLPHVIHIEKESVRSFDEALKIEPKNAMIHSSKASALGKFSMLEEMLKSAEIAESLLLSGNEATLAPDQIEYIMSQNKIKVELLKEVRKLANAAERLHTTMTTGIEIAFVTAGHETALSGAEERALSHHSPLAVSSARLLCALPSLREIEGFDAEDGLVVTGTSGFISPHTYQRASTSEAAAAAPPTLDCSVSPVSLTRNFMSASSGTKTSVVTPPADTPTAPSLLRSTSVEAHAGAGGGAGSGATAIDHTDSAPHGFSALTSGAMSTMITSTPEATLTRHATQHPKDFATIAKAAHIVQTSLKAASTAATVTVLKANLEELRAAYAETVEHQRALIEHQRAVMEHQKALTEELTVLRSGLGHALAHDREFASWSEEARAVDSHPSLSQYRDGFTKTFQKFMIGSLARNSGLVGDKVYEIPGLSMIPLPPIADSIVKALHAAGGMAVKIREDNKITTSLNCISNPLHFATDVVPKIACKFALMPDKQVSIRYGLSESRCGIFKIVDIYEALRDSIWQAETPTYASQLGAEDAIKIIAILKAGNINLSGSHEKDSENIAKVMVAFSATVFEKEITRADIVSEARTEEHVRFVGSIHGGSQDLADTAQTIGSSPLTLAEETTSRTATAVTTRIATGDDARTATGDEARIAHTTSGRGFPKGIVSAAEHSDESFASSVAASEVTRHGDVHKGLNVHHAPTPGTRSWGEWFSKTFCCCCKDASTVDHTAHSMPTTIHLAGASGSIIVDVDD